MKNQKTVKITGLEFIKSLGIIQATKLVFDPNKKFTTIKGAVGVGKTTFKKGLELGTQGSKTLIDKELYGEVNLEVQLLDGELPLWVGVKTNKDKKVSYVLYSKDDSGKKIKNPVIDGNEATPAKYFEQLQTELTWKMPELISENPSVQKKILLKLYQSQLSKIGVIFDKNHPDYELSILGQIDKAVSFRDVKDFERKQIGGIAEDLKAQGNDPDRPESCPEEIPISEIETEIKRLEKEKNIKEAEPEATKKAELAEIKAKASEITNKCLTYNSELKAEFDTARKLYDDYAEQLSEDNKRVTYFDKILNDLQENEQIEPKDSEKISNLFNECLTYPQEIKDPFEPNLIQFDDKNQVTTSENLDQKGIDLINEITKLRTDYSEKYSNPSTINTADLKKQIELQEENKKKALEVNKIVAAIDSFHRWRAANEDVLTLKNKYLKLLAQVDTGVEGLEIIPDEDNIFLMYDGSYDPKYFGNENKEMRKLSSYSGTQKPVICLLIQSYLLSKKAKAMRYIYIDDVPIDNKTIKILEEMTEKLDIHVFLNHTGDFDKSELKDGEILIQGGEVFF